MNQDINVSTDYPLILARYQFLGIDQILNRTNPPIVISYADNYDGSNMDSGQKLSGSKDFTNIRDGKLNVTFASALAANSIVSVFARFAKVMINKSGTLVNL